MCGAAQEGDVREVSSDPEGYVTEELNEEGLRVRPAHAPTPPLEPLLASKRPPQCRRITARARVTGGVMQGTHLRSCVTPTMHLVLYLVQYTASG
jgi:hypothetical protein